MTGDAQVVRGSDVHRLMAYAPGVALVLSDGHVLVLDAAVVRLAAAALEADRTHRPVDERAREVRG